MAKASRSQFIEKLHNLLEHPLDPNSLRWVSPEAFEITCDDRCARNALSPSWDFRSLSSFIRQLSYYNFKRLSDRRRSSERRTTATGYIVFSHPSGFFVRGDASRLHGIVRKTRNRPEKTGIRRASSSSMASQDLDDDEPAPPMPSWIHQDSRQLTGYTDRRVQHYPSGPNFEPPFPSVRQSTSTDAPWRGFENPTHSGWNDQQQQQQHQRRSPDYPPQTSPRSKPRLELAEPFAANAVRRVSSLSIIPNAPPAHDDDYRSAYPTPTFGSYPSRPSSLSSSAPSRVAMPFDESRASYKAPYHSHSPGTYSSHQALPSPTASAYSSESSDSHHEDHPPFNPQLRTSLSGNLDPRSSLDGHASAPYFPPPHSSWDNGSHGSGRPAEQLQSYHPAAADGTRR